METVSGSTDYQSNGDDLLWQQLKSVPAFRALLRSVEARFYHAVDLPQPVLDIGCGDGNFGDMVFDEPIAVGMDPWINPLRQAHISGAYALSLQAVGNRLPFADAAFASAFSNSVLEHIVDVQPVLNETSRVLKIDSPFVLTVPSQFFGEYLAGAGFFDRLGLDGMADIYRGLFNRLARNAHTDPPQIWADRLAQAGFSIERWQYYFSKDALQALELGHAQGVPSAVLHALTGHWILGPWESNLRRTERWIRPYYEEEFPQEGAFLYFLARKTADEPLTPTLPEPLPYSKFALQELITAGSREAGPVTERESEPTEQTNVAVETAKDPPSREEPQEDSAGEGVRLVIPWLLVALTFFFAMMGQSAIRAAPDQPAGGMLWFILSAGALLLLLWQKQPAEGSASRSWTWPTFAAIPRQRWLYLPAILLSAFAYRIASSPEYLNPAIPLGIWAAAIALAWYALDQETAGDTEPETRQRKEDQRFNTNASVVLFLVALVLRIYDLAQHPFILSGSEASMGLEALNVFSGLQNNPFAAGWLTNPTLPFFLQAIPLRLLGPSTESIRLLSAIIGALTVPVLFLLGQRLYGRGVGLAAAILLAGSHFHVHYSRLGLTNVWDALLVLLTLGLIAVAWQKNPQENRTTWLAAGTALGFSVYLYTSSHLLPIMLLLLVLVLVVFDRVTFRRQSHHLLAMLALALLIALPQLLHYQSSPGVFMARANLLGILDGQSGWLSFEATRSGLSQLELLGDQFWRSALAFNATLDTGTYYGPLFPLLNFFFGLLAVLGFILALVWLRQVRYSILVVWVAVTIIFAGMLLVDPPNSHRFIIAMPAVSLLAAIALEKLVGALTGYASGAETQPDDSQMKLAYFGIILLVAMVSAVYDTGAYFRAYRQEHHFADRNTEVADQMASYLHDLEGDWVAHFYGPPAMYVSFPTIPFLANNFEEGVNLFNVPEAGTPEFMPGSPSTAFLFLPERYGEIEQLRAEYPAGNELVFHGYYADPLFYVYEVRDNP